MMSGIPKVWQVRFTGWRWLVAYWAIHSALVRFPSMAKVWKLDEMGVVAMPHEKIP